MARFDLPDLSASDRRPARRERAVEAMLAGRNELRADLGNPELPVTGWLVVIDEEAQDAARGARLMLLGDEAQSEAGREACKRALARLGAAALEALEALDRRGLLMAESEADRAEQEYRLVDEDGVPLDDDREEFESPEQWLHRWQTDEGWPTARLQVRDVTAGEWVDA